MTRTIQQNSSVYLNKKPPPGAVKKAVKPETDNHAILASVCDSLNALYEALNRLDRVMKKQVHSQTRINDSL